MTLPPGTLIEGSSDPRTVEQNAAIRGMQTQSTGEIGSQYAGSLILPDGTVTRDMRYLTKPPGRVAEIDAVLNAAGKRNADGSVSGGYVLILNTAGVPVQYMGVSAGAAQTVAERAMGAAISPAQQSSGITHRTAIQFAAQGVQTDGTPVTDSYLTLIERWAREEGIPFTRPSLAQVAAVNTAVPASVVLASGQGIAAVTPGPLVDYATPKPSPMNSPTFTQGAILAEDFTPAPLRVPTNPPTPESYRQIVTATAMPPVAPEEDASVQAAKVKMWYVIGGVAAAVALVYLATRK